MLTIRPVIKYDCDIIIAGGGPSGSGLAFHLASRGYKVIVVEADIFPRDKVCGDGVSPIALAELRHMGITQTSNFEEANEIKKVGLFIKNDKVIINLSKPDNLPFHARIIPRLQLDQWIAEAAQKVGAHYLESSRVLNYTVKPDFVSAEIKQHQKLITLRARLIVGADGSRSTIARQLNGSGPDDEFQLLGLRSYFNQVNGPTDRVDIYFSEESFPGIFWMFPVGANNANIGMAMVSKTFPVKKTHAREMLQAHIREHTELRERIGPGKMEGKIQGWPINFYNRNNQITATRILLIGDAAGLINPLSGDGIQYALLSARWASETIIQALVKNEFSAHALQGYKQRVEKELGYDFALSNLLVQFPRNKSFSKLWFSILEVMIARAKEDKQYADTIAGIFEGTYPSYAALNASFILKSAKQGINELGKTIAGGISRPETMMDSSVQGLEKMLTLISDLNTNQNDHISWLKNTISKTILVGTQVLRNRN